MVLLQCAFPMAIIKNIRFRFSLCGYIAGRIRLWLFIWSNIQLMTFMFNY